MTRKERTLRDLEGVTLATPGELTTATATLRLAMPGVRLRMFNKVSDTIEKELAAPTYTVVYDKLKLNAYVHSAQLEVPPKAGRQWVKSSSRVRHSSTRRTWTWRRSERSRARGSRG